MTLRNIMGVLGLVGVGKTTDEAIIGREESSMTP